MGLSVRSIVWTAGVATLLAGGLLAITYWPRQTTKSAGGVWTCSMHPQVRQSGPGHCPICGMDLVPIEELSDAQASLAERAGLETVPIKNRDLFKEVRTVGKIDYNERQVALISARTAGRIDRVFADFTGVQVKKDDHLLNIYSPELFVGQGELIRALEQMKKVKERPGAFEPGFAEANLEAARTKLRLLGLLPEQIAEIEKSGKTATHLTVYAPLGGTVIEKSVRAGQYVKEGDPLYRIADLDPIWLYLDLYEYDLGWVRTGQKVEVSVEAYPNERFTGTVVFIDPFLDDRTRTVRARVNLKNPERRLKPAMYASATVRVALRSDGTPESTGLEGKYLCPMHPDVVKEMAGKCPICEMTLEKVPQSPAPPKGHDGLDHSHHHMANDIKESSKKAGLLAIPIAAVLDTGRRQIAYRQKDDGAYELVELRIGQRTEGTDDRGRPAAYYPVFSGLREGDRVVVRGGFLLDSQRQIEGMPSLLFPNGQTGTNLHSGHGGPPAPSNGGHKH
ncbi:MAG: efflux RND transporter periplasmic adaptor subunit [Planctomycetes bacterium]|nr:efflux RND transporter periplasmic adaptor subunit [Planctomycetota bacterium]